MRLFDTHTHLADARFDDDRASVILRMKQAGVEIALVVGDGAGDPSLNFELALRHDFLYAAVGVHPHDASCWNSERSEMIERWMEKEKLVALGEIGLDYHYDYSPRDAQRLAFDEQLELAYRVGKPVILHIREAHGDSAELLRERRRAGRLPRGVMHCFTGSWESAREYVEMGFYISLSGAVTFKNAPKLAEVAKNVPLDRLMVETDCPYMAPVPMRGNRNEPAYVEYVARKIAELRGMDADEFADATLENGRRLFGVN